MSKSLSNEWALTRIIGEAMAKGRDVNESVSTESMVDPESEPLMRR